MCRVCRGHAWDAFYIVANSVDRTIKFGVTTGDGRRRLRVHRRYGYDQVVRLLTGLPGSAAHDIERSVKSTLRLAGETPALGYEYFGEHTLTTVLDIVDNFPVMAGPPTDPRLPKDRVPAPAKQVRVDDGMKRCLACRGRKPRSAFTKHAASKDGLQPSCAECTRRAARAYYAANREHLRGLAAGYRERARSTAVSA